MFLYSEEQLSNSNDSLIDGYLVWSWQIDYRLVERLKTNIVQQQ